MIRVVSTPTDDERSRLERLLRELAPVRIAVSGGVDSLTLAILAGRVLADQAAMLHAVARRLAGGAGRGHAASH